MSNAVYNGFIEVWIAFGNWCCGKRSTGGKRYHMQGTKRLLKNPFAGLGKLDVNQDRRREARALTEEELSRLLSAARLRPIIDAETVRNGMNKGKRLISLSAERRHKLERLGHERALIYKTAILTGLRKSELRSLSVSDLSFGDLPFIKLKQKHEKNRQGSTIPLRSDLAKDLKAWVAGRELIDKVFTVLVGLLDIMDKDIAAAGIPKVDELGRVVHIHALRHSFGTHLSKAGVAPRVAQAAMRHSNISLTMSTYTDARLLDTSAAVESLPTFSLSDLSTTAFHTTQESICNQEKFVTVSETGVQNVAPNVAPTSVQPSRFESITGYLGDLSVLVAGMTEVSEAPEIRRILECGREDLNLQGVAPTRPST